jgi:LacI family transcriptional regulator
LAVQHLVSLGHRRIAMHLPSDAHFNDRERIEGYREGLAQAGTAWDPDLLFTHRLTGGSVIPPLGEGIDRLLRPDLGVTAIITDCVYMGWLDRLEQRGLRTPRDLSVVSFDDSFERPLYNPRLTVVAQDAGELGRIATREVIRQIESRHEKGREPFRSVLPTRLIERETTSPPPVRAQKAKAGVGAAESAAC